MIDWYKKSIFKNYFNFSGRASRREFWSFLLFHLPLLFIFFLPHVLRSKLGYELNSSPIGIFENIGGLYMLLTFIPSLAILVRRMHDTGRSGWNLLIFFIPLIGLFYCAAILLYMIDESEDGENKWGENPNFSF